MTHLVYRIEHIPSGRWYGGVTSLEIWKRGYMGSGRKWKNIVRKYSRSQFSREILFLFDDRDDAFKKEGELITQHILDTDPLCCNLKPGGRGYGVTKKNRGSYEKVGRKWSDVTREIHAQRQSDPIFLEKMSNALKEAAARRKEAGLPGANKGKQFDPEWCKKLGDCARGTSWWVNPEGVNKRTSEQPGPEWKKGRKYV